MKRLLLPVLFLLLALPLEGLSQQISVLDHVVFVGNQRFVHIPEDQQGAPDFSIYNLFGEEIINVQTFFYKGRYLKSVEFMDTGWILDLRVSQWELVQILYNWEIIDVHGQLSSGNIELYYNHCCIPKKRDPAARFTWISGN